MNRTQESESTTQQNDAATLLADFRNYLMKGALSPEHFSPFDQLINQLQEMTEKEKIRDEISSLRTQFPAIGSEFTMQGLAFVKKHGYAGDFEIIDKIYTQYTSDHPEFRTWDQFFHNQAAPQAVRNRKTYFKETLQKISASCADKEIHVLNLASGPCRDLLEFFQESGDERFRFTCVELDAHAIDYARELLGEFAHRVTFIQQNIFRFIPSEKYHLVWSAGLFDYFDDTTFTKILSRFIDQPYIIIGNFSDVNPTSGYMELIGEWYLHHRSPSRLIGLAVNAGFVADHIHIAHEPTEINLFLQIQR